MKYISLRNAISASALAIAIMTTGATSVAALTVDLNWSFGSGNLSGTSGSGTATIDTTSLTNVGTESLGTSALLGLDVAIGGFTFLVNQPSDLSDLSASAGFEFFDGELSLLNIKAELPANLSLYYTSFENEVSFSEVGSGLAGTSRGALSVSEASSIAPVPLPAGWLLICSGLFALASMRRKQTTAAA